MSDEAAAAPRPREPYGKNLARLEADYPDFSVYGKRSGLYAGRARGGNGRLVGDEVTAETLDELAGKFNAARRRMDGA